MVGMKAFENTYGYQLWINSVNCNLPTCKESVKVTILLLVQFIPYNYICNGDIYNLYIVDICGYAYIEGIRKVR